MQRRAETTQDGVVRDSEMTAATARRVTELIELGRDREAAELASNRAASIEDHGPPPAGGPMDALTQLEELGPLLAGTVAEISADQLDNPTPCTELTVRGVLEHMIEGATSFAAAFRGADPAAADTTDVLSGFLPALSGLAEAIEGEGALERTIHAPFGDVPGDTFARFVVLDGLVHGWDLATSTGQRYAPSDALVAAVQSFADDTLGPLRDGQTFGQVTEAPPSATPIERLAAFTGRQV